MPGVLRPVLRIPDRSGVTAMLVRPVLALLVAVMLAACGVGIGPDTPVTDDGGGGQAPSEPTADGTLTIVADPVEGPALEVRDALAAAPGEPVLVAGSLFIDAAGRVLLCGAIAESFPPQCAGERVEVIGLDLDQVAELEEANGVRWAEGVELSGTVS